MAQTTKDAGGIVKSYSIDCLSHLFGNRFLALVGKEVAQIRHNRQLLIQLLVPPTLFLILFGLALNPTFRNLNVGITDYSQSPYSREFIEVFQQTNAFVVKQFYTQQQQMLDDLGRGKLTVAVTIPPEFDRDLVRQRPTEIQAVLDAVDANTASVASGYLSRLVNDYNQRQLMRHLRQRGIGTSTTSTVTQQTSIANPTFDRPSQVQLQTSVFYNPGLESSWFILPGTLGILMTVLGSQAAASLVVREKEAGTIEQLMMTPASTTQIILAKILPLLALLMVDATIALLISRSIFKMPFRGNFFLFMGISLLYFFIGISLGIAIATYAKSEQQAQLSAFFINPPLVLLSGAMSPISAMPPLLQWLTYLDPMRYYIEICRSIILKGVGLEVLWPQVLILLIFAVFLTTLSLRQFRNQFS